MLRMAPLPVDDDALGQAVEGLERQLNGMAENLGQFQPTIGLTPEGRLMYALAEDPNGPTNALYPVGGYAKPLHPETITPRHRLRRVAGNARRLITRLTPFAMTQGLPAAGAVSVNGQVMTLGFMSSQGLDVCWDGHEWHMTAGVFRFSEVLPDMTPKQDIKIKAQQFAAKSGLFYVKFGVQFLLKGGVTITSATVEFHAGGDMFAVLPGSAFRIDGSVPTRGTYPVSPGSVMSPLAYVLAPSKTRQAPVVLRMGNGVFPTGYIYSIPTSFSAAGVSPFDP